MAVNGTAYPFDDVDSTGAQYQTVFHLLQPDGLNGSPGAGDGQVSSGTGYTVNVAAIALAYVAGVIVTTPSGTVTLDAPSAQARIDRIVLRVDSGANTAVVDKLTGVAGASSPKALTQIPGGVWEIPIARVAVAAGAANIVAGNITDERVYLPRRIVPYTTSTRPAGAKGDFGFNFSTNVPEYHDGTTWKPFSVSWTSITGKPTPTDQGDLFESRQPGWSQNRADVVKQDRTVSFEFSFDRTGSTIAGSGDGDIPNVLIATLAAQYRPANDFAPLTPSAGGPLRTAYVRRSGEVYIAALLPGMSLPSGREITFGATYLTSS